jgi:hypothetical protein
MKMIEIAARMFLAWIVIIAAVGVFAGLGRVLKDFAIAEGGTGTSGEMVAAFFKLAAGIASVAGLGYCMWLHPY